MAICEHATGVTEGKLDTQSGISVPRSSSFLNVGAAPEEAARSSISVCSESTTTSISLR